MSRWRRVFVICGLAAVLGIVLAYRDGAGRQPAPGPDTGPSPAVLAARGQPWPEPKAPDVSPLAPVPERPKRAEPTPPKAEPKPEPPPPEGPSGARQAAYQKIVAAWDRVEAAAVHKYGRKPRPDDRAEFAIPYKAFVNTQTQVARKRLATDLGVSEREVDQIKAEGDKAGWPRQ